MLSPSPFRAVAAITLCTLAAACGTGGSEGGANAVSLKDLEVVDGTTSDAMTDLDGVKTEGTALAPVSANASGPVAPRPAHQDEESDNSAAAPEEVVSDQ